MAPIKQSGVNCQASMSIWVLIEHRSIWILIDLLTLESESSLIFLLAFNTQLLDLW